MTVTVTVRTRAWPATVTIKGAEGAEDEKVEVAGHSEHVIHVESAQDFNVTQNPPATDEAEAAAPIESGRPFEGEKVPGAEENDRLLGRGRRQPAAEEVG